MGNSDRLAGHWDAPTPMRQLRCARHPGTTAPPQFVRGRSALPWPTLRRTGPSRPTSAVAALCEERVELLDIGGSVRHPGNAACNMQPALLEQLIHLRPGLGALAQEAPVRHPGREDPERIVGALLDECPETGDRGPHEVEVLPGDVDEGPALEVEDLDRRCGRGV